MPMRHLNQELFDRLLRDGELSAEEKRELAWHLLETCPDCAEVADVEWQLAPAEDSAADHRPIPAEEVSTGESPVTAGASRLDEPEETERISLGRVRQRLEGTITQLFRQKDEASELMGQIESHPAERQRLLVLNDARFHTVPFAELWLDRIWQRGFEDPHAAEEMARTVLELSDRIPAEPLGREVIYDVRGRAWSLLGNLRRILGDFRAADEAFARAREYLSRGTGDLLETARLYDLKSTLRRNQLRFAEARDLIEKAANIYLSTGENHLAGRAMISRGLLLAEEGRPEQAIAVLREALTQIELEREPRLGLVAQQNLVARLQDLGRSEEALSLLPKVRRLTIEIGSRFELLRLRWLEGKILLSLGHEGRAEAAFMEVRKGFTDLEAAYDMATVSLDLAALYLRQGRTAEIKRLAAEMLPIFESRDVHQEALAALMLFKRAVEMESLTARMVEEVADVLQRARRKPRPPAQAPS